MTHYLCTVNNVEEVWDRLPGPRHRPLQRVHLRDVHDRPDVCKRTRNAGLTFSEVESNAIRSRWPKPTLFSILLALVTSTVCHWLDPRVQQQGQQFSSSQYYFFHNFGGALRWSLGCWWWSVMGSILAQLNHCRHDIVGVKDASTGLKERSDKTRSNFLIAKSSWASKIRKILRPLTLV